VSLAAQWTHGRLRRRRARAWLWEEEEVEVEEEETSCWGAERGRERGRESRGLEWRVSPVWAAWGR
jgi:hypothetical protein